MSQWDQTATKQQVESTMQALKANGMNSHFVETLEEAKALVLSLIPEKSEVMTMTSVTVDQTGVTQEINESGKYDSVKAKLAKLDRATQSQEMQKLGAAPQYALGSVHAITQDGRVVIASNTGSQLPAHVYGASNVIWVVGTQKIVANLDSALKRLDEHTLPLESARAQKAYGVAGSSINKLLIINKEVNPNRIHIVFVNQNIGY